LVWFILGLLLGFLLDVLWWHKGFNKYEKGKLKWCEHWTWAILLAMIPHEFFWGLASALLIEERFQKHFFSIGSGHEKPTFIIGAIEIVLLLASLFFY